MSAISVLFQVAVVNKALVVKSPSIPVKPGKELLRSHHFTHQPYRSWCRWCVMWEAHGVRHKVERAPRDHPVIFIDYMYLTGNKKDARTVLVGHDDHCRCIGA